MCAAETLAWGEGLTELNSCQNRKKFYKVVRKRKYSFALDRYWNPMCLQGTQLPWLDIIPRKLSNNNMLWVLSWTVSDNMVIYQLLHVVFLAIYSQKQQDFKSLQNSPYLLSLLAQTGSLFALSGQPKGQHQRAYIFFLFFCW